MICGGSRNCHKVGPMELVLLLYLWLLEITKVRIRFWDYLCEADKRISYIQNLSRGYFSYFSYITQMTTNYTIEVLMVRKPKFESSKGVLLSMARKCSTDSGIAHCPYLKIQAFVPLTN